MALGIPKVMPSTVASVVSGSVWLKLVTLPSESRMMLPLVAELKLMV